MYTNFGEQPELQSIREVTPRVKQFTRNISPKNVVFLKPENVDKCYLADRCHINVLHFIKHNGGNIQYGWLLYELIGARYLAVFHSVVRTDAGELAEITPSFIGADIVAFLPDNRGRVDFANCLVPSNILYHKKSRQLFSDNGCGKYYAINKEQIGVPRIPVKFLRQELDREAVTE